MLFIIDITTELLCVCVFLFSVGVGDEQSYRLRHQRVLQHECVGNDLG